MKKTIIFFAALIINSNCYASDFVHPLDFSGTEYEKELVIDFIVENVKESYSKIGMDDPMTLRMMEKEELKSFKELTLVQNRELLDNVINQYCAIDMCNYNTILMMYKEQSKASQSQLNW